MGLIDGLEALRQLRGILVRGAAKAGAWVCGAFMRVRRVQTTIRHESAGIGTTTRAQRIKRMVVIRQHYARENSARDGLEP